MKRNTVILAALVVLLWGIWYLSSSSERRALSVKERRDFFRVDSLTVDSIAIKVGTWTHLARRGRDWYGIFPGWTYPAESQILGEVLRTTNGMVLENLIATRSEKHRAFQVDTMLGTVMEFFAQGRPEAGFVLGKSGADFQHTYIRKLGSDSVYMARGDFQRVFRRAPSEWVSRTIFDVDTAGLEEVRWIGTESETRLARAPDRSWRVFKGALSTGMPPDTSILNVKLRRLCPLKADAFAPEGGTVTANLEHPGSQLIVTAAGGRADTLLWNPLVEKEDRTYAFHPGRSKPLFIFFRGTYDRLFGRYEDLVRKADTTKPGA